MRSVVHRLSFPIALRFLVCLMSFASPAFAIEIANDADVGWANNPNCVAVPALCNPEIIGAPRVVSDMRDNAALLLFLLDFDEVSVADFLGPSYIQLNIADTSGNAILRPGGITPLQLQYVIPLSADDGSGGLAPATDFTVNLTNFGDFALLPTGDLLFTVFLRLNLDLPHNQTFGPNNTLARVATLTVSGPGTVVSVPEPSALLLSLLGLTSLALGAPYLRRLEKR